MMVTRAATGRCDPSQLAPISGRIIGGLLLEDDDLDVLAREHHRRVAADIEVSDQVQQVLLQLSLRPCR